MSAHYQPYQYGQPPAAPDSHMDGAPGGQIPPTPHRTHASPAAAQRPATATHQAPPRTPGSGHSAAHHPMPLGHSASAPHSAGHPHAHAGTGSGLYANGHGQSHGPAQAASLHHSPAPVHASASAGGYPMPHQSHHPQSHAQQHHHVPRPRPAVPTHPASAASAHSDARAAAAMAAYDVDEDDNDDHYEDEDDEEAAREAARRERRQAELMERVEQLNRTFWERRGIIFQQKLESYRRELKEIRLGQHPDYLEALAQLERERDAAILKAELFREYELQCAQEIYDKEHEAALAEYMAEKEGLREKMLGDLEERKRKLKEDRDSFDVSSDAAIETHKTIGTRKTTRQAAPRFDDSKKPGKRNRANNDILFLALIRLDLPCLALTRPAFALDCHCPCLAFCDEIFADLTLISKAQHQNVRKATQAFKNRK